MITSISLNVALAIGVTECFNQIEKFSKEATDNEYTTFTHYNFFFSYPGWGKSWVSGKSCEFHRVKTKCHSCDWEPERNYAGIGTIYLLNNGICNDEILISNGYKIIRGRKIPMNEYVPNTPRFSRMILLCKNHVGSHFEWRKNKEVEQLKPIALQLSLF